MAELCLQEYGLLVQGKRTTDSLRVCGIDSQQAWDFLEKLAFSAEKDNRFIEVAQFEGNKALRVVNFVGVISTPDGTQIEILPKTSEAGQDCQRTRALLWKMLGAVEDLRFLETTDAQLMLRTQPLSEALISLFLGHVASLVRRGIRKDYERVEEEERFLRGRLRLVQQLRQPPGRQHLFQIEYDLFSENRAENRLIHSALMQAGKWSRSENNQRLAREFRHGFESVPVSGNYQSDFPKWRTGRDMVHYQPLLPWVRLILNQQCPFSLKDEHAGISFLFPMEKLFEKYVARIFARELLPRRLTVHTQLQNQHLSNAPKAFMLKPDLGISSGGTWVSILDTKWKLIDSNATYDNGTWDPKSGIEQADMYQLFAYGHKYLGGKGRLFRKRLPSTVWT
jgi:5-methylcytosine-specific restriction enzyme subunit McrC